MAADMPHLLVVDDDPAIRGLLELIGKRQGFTVDTAADGVEALALLRETVYDLAVIDLMMPRINGYELIAQLAEMPRRPLILIATAMTDTLVAQLDASVVHSIVRKPFDVEILAAMLRELGPGKGQKQQSEAPSMPLHNRSSQQIEN
jgi:DNA-binding response OmpR family regulator